MEIADATTLHVRRARDGDDESLAWLFERFSPALVAQARFRLGRHLRGLYDPEDLVQDAWAAVLPRLGDLRPRDGRLTPVLLRFLGTALLNRYGTLMQKHIAGKPLCLSVEEGGEPGDLLVRLPADQTGAVTRAMRREAVERVLAALDELPEADREIVVLRGIEQVTPSTAAQILGVSENAASVRYHRALRRLRERLPGSIFEELSPE